MSVNFEKAQAVFLEAVKRSDPDEQIKYLDEACGDDRELRQHLEILLNAHGQSGSFLEKGALAVDPTLDQPITEKPGTQIGPYKLLQQIGEGGMGVVYMAEQKEPVKRRVALKIIKPGMDTRQVVARFEAERQALAMMDHPNIAKVLDAGQTESGRPYFVMELVNGIAVTKYCDEQHLTPKERLELFVPICQAVQHAHQKGIIHRDLKPSNILVALYDGQAVPKVIDFGVAKATNQTLTEKTMFTQLGQVVGTLEYMSPEQAERNQLDIDTRSDIYSLGVVLYELLTGETPFDRERLRSAAFDEMLRIIREEEPSKPSTKVSGSQSLPSIAANRRIEPAKLGSMIRGELDWIVLKAMEKDRGRRYETASKFAEDVQQYLKDEPVVACPPSPMYRFRKFARRNKVAIATASVVAASILVGIAATSWQAARATQQRNRALLAEEQAIGEAQRAGDAERVARERLAVVERQRDKIAKEQARAANEEAIAQAILSFLETDLLGSSATHSEPDRDLKLRIVLDRASQRVEMQFSDQPHVEASIRTTLGDSYLSLGEFDAARSHLEKAVELNKQTTVAGSSRAILPKILLAELEHDLGNYSNSETLMASTLAKARKLLPPSHELTLRAQGRLADLLRHRGDLSGAEELFKQTVAAMRDHLGETHPQTLLCQNDLAMVMLAGGRTKEAEQVMKDVIATSEKALGHEHPRTLESRSNLAGLYLRLNKLALAERVELGTLATKRRVLGSNHPMTLVSMKKLANIAQKQGRSGDAHAIQNDILARRKAVYGDDNSFTLETERALASGYVRARQFDQAESLYKSQIARLTNLVSQGKAEFDDRYELVRSYRRLGALALRKPDPENAFLAIKNEVVEIIPQLLVDLPANNDSRKKITQVADWFENAKAEPIKTIRGWCSAWGPESRRLLYNAGQTSAYPKAMLRCLDLQTGKESEVVFGGKDPAWARQGPQRIAFVRNDAIFVSDSDGTDSRKIGIGDFPVWSKDGDVLFYRDAEDGYIKSINVSIPESTPKQHLKSPFRYPQVSPDGSMVVTRRDNQLVIVDLETEAAVQIHDVEHWRGLVTGWSGDSRFVAFADYGDGSGIWAMNVETGNVQQLFKGPYSYPRWSPDGKFMSCDNKRDGTVEIFRTEDLKLPD